MPVPTVYGQMSNFFALEVIDSVSGRGVPLVQVAVGGEKFFTDSAGIVAIDQANLLNQDLKFDFASYGYESTSQQLTPVLGNSAQLPIVRNNRAERLYRATGANIYADSVKAGQPAPIAKPISNAKIRGQDSVQATVYNNQVHWFWGDSLFEVENGCTICGNYWTSGATSQLPEQGGLPPNEGIDFTYYEDDAAKTRPMFPQYQSTGKPVWVDGLFTATDSLGNEKLLAHYVNVESFLPQYVLREQGLAIFNDSAERFIKAKDYGVAPAQVWGTGPPILPAGHSFRHSTGGEEYLYFGENYPNVRVRDNWDDVMDITQWEAFTPLMENSRYDKTNPPLELDSLGHPVYGWKKNVDPLGTEIFEEMVAQGHLNRTEAPVGLVDFEGGGNVKLHRSSVNWNEYRQKWIMIGNESAGDGSFLGEVWYSEAPTPVGPWKNAIKIATHGDPTGELGGSYSFYNPTQLPFFDEAEGRYIHFHGTYSSSLFDSAPETPDYDYNQVAYRLDLATIPKLSADVLAADFNADGLVDQYDLSIWQSAFGVDEAGDANRDGQTDGADFIIWQQQVGSRISFGGARSSLASVPEPPSLGILLTSLLFSRWYFTR